MAVRTTTTTGHPGNDEALVMAVLQGVALGDLPPSCKVRVLTEAVSRLRASLGEIQQVVRAYHLTVARLTGGGGDGR